MLSTASELKYTSEIKKVLAAQIESPDEEFARFFFHRITPGGRFTSVMKEQFLPLVSKAFQQFLSDRVSDRLRIALEGEKDRVPEVPPEDTNGAVDDGGIVTTDEEMEGFNIVRAIASKAVHPSRVVHRDTKSYMGILLDDNNRKPICRLWFNAKKKYLGIINGKDETRIPIDSAVDIYQYADQILETLESYPK
jgi:hypothetical protein